MTYLEKILILRKKVLNYSTESTKWLLSKIKKSFWKKLFKILKYVAYALLLFVAIGASQLK